MKKILLSAASLLILLGSCSQNEWDDNIVSNEKNVVSATIEGQTNSRLSVTHNETTNIFSLAWSTGDAFKVFGENDEAAVYNWSAGDEFTLKSDDTAPSTPQYAIYPYSETNAPSIAGGVVTMTLSATPSVENVNLPMWAGAPVGSNYAFKHLAAAVQFTLNDIPQGYNSLIVEASKPISGTFTATLTEAAPALASSSTDEGAKMVTVSFTNNDTEKQNKVFYIPLPANTYESLKISVSNGTETKELKSWTNLEVVRGKMYYTTAVVDASSVANVNSVLANAGEAATIINLPAAIDASEGGIDIPDAAKNVSFNFTTAPSTSDEAPLVFNQNEGATSGEATTKLNIDMPAESTGLYAEINTPTATTTMKGGTYAKVTATTATNTLIIGEGTIVKKLIIKGGNVVLQGGQVEEFVQDESNNTITEVTLEDDITLTAPVQFNNGKYTLNLNGKTISQEKACTASYGMITNKGTLTIVDSSEDNAGKISFKDTGAGDSNFGWGVYTLINSGTLKVEEGTIENLSQQNTAGNVVHMYCAIQSTGTTTIKGGKISTPTYRSVRPNKGSLIIEGGTFEGQVWLQPNQGDVTLQISGGTFAPTGGDGSSIFMTNTGENYTVSSASITGGLFTTKIGCTTPDNTGVKGCITGGTFTETATTNTNSALLAEGYSFVKSEDYYVVLPNTTE